MPAALPHTAESLADQRAQVLRPRQRLEHGSVRLPAGAAGGAQAGPDGPEPPDDGRRPAFVPLPADAAKGLHARLRANRSIRVPGEWNRHFIDTPSGTIERSAIISITKAP